MEDGDGDKDGDDKGLVGLDDDRSVCKNTTYN